jgi:GABA(A) receptor-associated protein
MDLLKKKNMKESLDKVRIKYPNKIPLFIYRSKRDKSLQDLTCNKFLVPDTITVGQFMMIVRKRLKLDSNIALFVFINNTIPCSSETILQIYENHKNKDGMLVLEYCGENVFG